MKSIKQLPNTGINIPGPHQDPFIVISSLLIRGTKTEVMQATHGSSLDHVQFAGETQTELPVALANESKGGRSKGEARNGATSGREPPQSLMEDTEQMARFTTEYWTCCRPRKSD